jgi:hypothetical protein
MKIRPAGAELFDSGKGTDATKLEVALVILQNTPNKALKAQ